MADATTPAELLCLALEQIYYAHHADGSNVSAPKDALALAHYITSHGWLLRAPVDPREIDTPHLHVIELGQAMRDLQRAYFKSRTSAALIASKNAEGAFDRAVAALNIRPDLFSQKGGGG